MFEIYRERIFAASHQLREYNGKCERLHGHNWRVRVHLTGKTLDKSGMLLDFHELDRIMEKVISRFDHRHLNDVTPFTQINPSSENLSKVIFEEVSALLPAQRDIKVKYCDVWETDQSRARYVSDELSA
jgi:6-pyruvoyltetrahydropterin/6-carboxytetrahydropterin synthase